ncbi:superoxide dismutase family protein [Altibacter sp.]|uniref:superoxide dismutase family protein n=1 Tax=Altibacter sp. TaxID=2024823 RepID=UPI000C8A2FE5|nr:superoxide dismutase family protein [Altibacter sp.]MAP55005.1 superoxide dismutase [Altibacter sp.]
MKKIALSIATIALLGTVSCKNDKKEMDAENEITEEMVEDTKEVEQEVKSVEIRLMSKSDSKASGKAYFTEENGIVTFEAKVEGLDPGTHAIHIHESADCSAADGSSAGGHWNPTFAPHGKWGDAGGYHKGDIGNFEADESGSGSISMQTDEWCIGCGDEKKDILGKSIIVHQGADDFKSQPSGDAGARVSCGGIIQQ